MKGLQQTNGKGFEVSSEEMHCLMWLVTWNQRKGIVRCNFSACADQAEESVSLVPLTKVLSLRQVCYGRRTVSGEPHRALGNFFSI